VLRPDAADDGRTVTVRYHGSVPDTFRQGRQIVVDGRVAGSTFEATPDSLVAKCPSKYDDTPAANA
jgi:cytochrome c-type biogenesis protein CcmE